MFIHILYTYKPNGGLLHLKPGSSSSARKAVRTHSTMHRIQLWGSVQHAAWQHSGAPLLVSKESRDSRRGERHWASVSVSLAWTLGSALLPTQWGLVLFPSVIPGNTLSQCPRDRGWSPAAAPHDTTAGSLCSAGRSPSRPPQTSPSLWRGTRPHRTSPHTGGASWCGQSSFVPSHPQIQRPGSSVCRGGWSAQWQTSAPPPAPPS